MKTRTFLLLFLLGAAIALTLFISRSGDIETSQPGTFKHSFYLQNFTLTRFDKDGQLKHVMKGKQIDQDAVTGESQITQLQAALFKDGTVNWKITAQKGWMNKDQTQARLENKVVMQQTIPPLTRATTAELNLNLVEKSAENKVPVQITQGENKLEGSGLYAKLDQNLLKLKAEVRGIYVP